MAVLPLSAAQVNIFNTGVNGAGVALGAADTDQHWTCSVNCSGNAFQAQGASGGQIVAGEPAGFPVPSTQNGNHSTGPWAASTMNGGNPVSQWISFASDVNSAPNATTEYDYTQTFNLSNFIANTLVLTGNFAVDNIVLDILINGHPVTGFANSGSFSPLTAFTINKSSCGAVVDCGLVAGSNTITFKTENVFTPNNGDFTNPTGLLVEFTSATADPTGVPEPATLFGVGLGLSILGLVYRRRRS